MNANIILESFVRGVMPQRSPKEHVSCFLDYPFLDVSLVSTKNGLLIVIWSTFEKVLCWSTTCKKEGCVLN
jgi:hypothetical protein